MADSITTQENVGVPIRASLGQLLNYVFSFLLISLLFTAVLPSWAEPAGSSDSEQWQYPQQRMLGSHRVVLHAPQIRSWPDFTTMQASMAVEMYPDGQTGSPLYATLKISGATEL